MNILKQCTMDYKGTIRWFQFPLFSKWTFIIILCFLLIFVFWWGIEFIWDNIFEKYVVNKTKIRFPFFLSPNHKATKRSQNQVTGYHSQTSTCNLKMANIQRTNEAKFCCIQPLIVNWLTKIIRMIKLFYYSKIIRM